MPGETVIFPDEASKIGKSTLNRINHADRNGLAEKRTGGSINRFARGGYAQVPGRGRTDSFRTSLPPGSFVVRTDATSALGGPDGVIKAAKHKDGGVVQKLSKGSYVRESLKNMVSQKVVGSSFIARSYNKVLQPTDMVGSFINHQTIDIGEKDFNTIFKYIDKEKAITRGLLSRYKGNSKFRISHKGKLLPAAQVIRNIRGTGYYPSDIKSEQRYNTDNASKGLAFERYIKNKYPNLKIRNGRGGIRNLLFSPLDFDSGDAKFVSNTRQYHTKKGKLDILSKRFRDQNAGKTLGWTEKTPESRRLKPTTVYVPPIGIKEKFDRWYANKVNKESSSLNERARINSENTKQRFSSMRQKPTTIQKSAFGGEIQKFKDAGFVKKSTKGIKRGSYGRRGFKLLEDKEYGLFAQNAYKEAGEYGGPNWDMRHKPPVPKVLARYIREAKKYIFESGGAGIEITKAMPFSPKIDPKTISMLEGMGDVVYGTGIGSLGKGMPGFIGTEVMPFGKRKTRTKQSRSSSSELLKTKNKQNELLAAAITGVQKSFGIKGALTRKQMDELEDIKDPTFVRDLLQNNPIGIKPTGPRKSREQLLAQYSQSEEFKREAAGAYALARSGSSSFDFKSISQKLKSFKEGESTFEGVLDRSQAAKVKSGIKQLLSGSQSSSGDTAKAKAALEHFDSFIGGGSPQKPGHLTSFTWAVNQVFKRGLVKLQKGGLVQKLMSGSSELLTQPDILQKIAKDITRLGGIGGVKDLLGLSKGDREADKALRVTGGAVLPKYEATASQLVTKAKKAKISRVRQQIQDNRKKRGDVVKSQKKGLLFAAAGILGNTFAPIKKTIGQGILKNPVDVHITSGILNPSAAQQVEKILGESISKSTRKAAKAVMVSDILQKASSGQTINLDFDRTLAFGADRMLSDPKQPKFSEFSDPDKVREGLSKARLSTLGRGLRDLVRQNPQIVKNLRIVTARPPTTMPLIQDWLSSQGLPITNLVGVGGPGVSSSDVAKGKASKLSPGSVFVDDDKRNVRAAKRVKGVQAYRYGLRKPKPDANREGSIKGYKFEQIIEALGGPKANKSLKSIDFPRGLRGAARYFGLNPVIPTDAKRTLSGPSVVESNIINYLKAKGYKDGGSIPKLLTKKERDARRRGLPEPFAWEKENIGPGPFAQSARSPSRDYYDIGRERGLDDRMARMLADSSYSQGVDPVLFEIRLREMLRKKGINRASGGEIPIMAQEGEFVINKHAAGQIGHDRLEKLNRGGRVALNTLEQLPKYHSGGSVQKLKRGGVTGKSFNDLSSPLDLEQRTPSDGDKVARQLKVNQKREQALKDIEASRQREANDLAAYAGDAKRQADITAKAKSDRASIRQNFSDEKMRAQRDPQYLTRQTAAEMRADRAAKGLKTHQSLDDMAVSPGNRRDNDVANRSTRNRAATRKAERDALLTRLKDDPDSLSPKEKAKAEQQQRQVNRRKPDSIEKQKEAAKAAGFSTKVGTSGSTVVKDNDLKRFQSNERLFRVDEEREKRQKYRSTSSRREERKTANRETDPWSVVDNNGGPAVGQRSNRIRAMKYEAASDKLSARAGNMAVGGSSGSAIVASLNKAFAPVVSTAAKLNAGMAKLHNGAASLAGGLSKVTSGTRSFLSTFRSNPIQAFYKGVTSGLNGLFKLAKATDRAVGSLMGMKKVDIGGGKMGWRSSGNGIMGRVGSLFGMGGGGEMGEDGVTRGADGKRKRGFGRGRRGGGGGGMGGMGIYMMEMGVSMAGSALLDKAVKDSGGESTKEGRQLNTIGGSALSGATTGMMMGSMIGSVIPGLGTVLGGAAGAAIGGAAGAAYGYSQMGAVERQADSQKRMEAIDKARTQMSKDMTLSSDTNTPVSVREQARQRMLGSIDTISSSAIADSTAGAKTKTGFFGGVTPATSIKERMSNSQIAADSAKEFLSSEMQRTGKTLDELEQSMDPATFKRLMTTIALSDEGFQTNLEAANGDLSRIGDNTIKAAAMRASADLKASEEIMKAAAENAKLQQAIKKLTVSFERSADNMLNATAAAQNILTNASANISAISNPTQSAMIGASYGSKSQDVLSNPNAYSMEEVETAARSYSGLYGKDSEQMIKAATLPRRMEASFGQAMVSARNSSGSGDKMDTETRDAVKNALMKTAEESFGPEISEGMREQINSFVANFEGDIRQLNFDDILKGLQGFASGLSSSEKVLASFKAQAELASTAMKMQAEAAQAVASKNQEIRDIQSQTYNDIASSTIAFKKAIGERVSWTAGAGSRNQARAIRMGTDAATAADPAKILAKWRDAGRTREAAMTAQQSKPLEFDQNPEFDQGAVNNTQRLATATAEAAQAQDQFKKELMSLPDDIKQNINGIMEELQQVLQDRAAKINAASGFMEKVLTSTPKGLRELGNTFNNMNRALSGNAVSFQESYSANTAYRQVRNQGGSHMAAQRAAQDAYAKETGDTLNLAKELAPLLGAVDPDAQAQMMGSMYESMFAARGIDTSQMMVGGKSMKEYIDMMKQGAKADPKVVALEQALAGQQKALQEASDTITMLLKDESSKIIKDTGDAIIKAINETRIRFDEAQLKDAGLGISRPGDATPSGKVSVSEATATAASSKAELDALMASNPQAILDAAALQTLDPDSEEYHEIITNKERMNAANKAEEIAERADADNAVKYAIENKTQTFSAKRLADSGYDISGMQKDDKGNITIQPGQLVKRKTEDADAFKDRQAKVDERIKNIFIPETTSARSQIEGSPTVPATRAQAAQMTRGADNTSVDPFDNSRPGMNQHSPPLNPGNTPPAGDPFNPIQIPNPDHRPHETYGSNQQPPSTRKDPFVESRPLAAIAQQNPAIVTTQAMIQNANMSKPQEVANQPQRPGPMGLRNIHREAHLRGMDLNDVRSERREQYLSRFRPEVRERIENSTSRNRRFDDARPQLAVSARQDTQIPTVRNDNQPMVAQRVPYTQPPVSPGSPVPAPRSPVAQTNQQNPDPGVLNTAGFDIFAKKLDTLLTKLAEVSIPERIVLEGTNRVLVQLEDKNTINKIAEQIQKGILTKAGEQLANYDKGTSGGEGVAQNPNIMRS